MRIGNLSDDDVILLKLRQVNNENLRNDVNALFAENDPKDNYNCSKLENLQEQVIKISAIDKVSPELSLDVINNIVAKPLNKTGNLSSELTLKRYLRLILTANVEISDRLIYGQLGYIYNFAVNQGTATKLPYFR